VVGLLAAALAFAAFGVPGASAAGASAAGGSGASAAAGSQTGWRQHTGANGESDVNVCSDVVSTGQARCFARRRTDSTAESRRPARPGSLARAATLGNDGAYDPSFLQSAYQTPSATNGVGQTVAIVDAYDDPSAEADMGAYRSFFGLSACTTANGCFRKVSETGGTSYPAGNTGWGQEISLDLDMVSAICPNCDILLVEANSAGFSDLGAAVNEAVALGANVVSNSYGGSEWSTENLTSLADYDHPGVAITVAAGDSGYGPEFPAASNTVTAVGGTSLQQATNTGTRNATETVWSGTGSGCSAYQAKPAWQTDSGCPMRTISDVSAVADPSTGVWVYDSYGGGTWAVFGGTSVATPIVGSVYALAGNTSGSATAMNSLPYGHTNALNDIASGSNGTCSPAYLCTGEVGYDGPSGLGTPNGSSDFSAANAVPPPAPTVPPAPKNLQAVPGNASVSLSWSAPSTNGGSAVIGYNVYRGLSSGQETMLVRVTSTSYVATSLTNGTKYYFKVTAVNGVGEGKTSNEASATPEPTVPGPPSNLTARAATSKGVALSWSAPASNGGASITGYRLNRSTSSGRETFDVTVTCTATTCSYTDTGTRSGTTYYYDVAATNSAGTGSVSNQASAKAR